MGQYVKIVCFIVLFFTNSISVVFADSILNDLAPSVFGERSRGPKPEETLIAPFIDQKISPYQDQGTKGSLPQNLKNVIPLTVPHQDRAFMMEWVSTQVAGILTFNPHDLSSTSSDGSAAQTALFKKVFLEKAKADVQTLLALPYFTDRLYTKKMRIKAFVQTPAIIQNEGVFGDVYRWLVDVPVTMTFYPDGYIKDQVRRSSTFETKTITVRVQVARVSGEYPDGCAIESFTTSTVLP